MSKNNVVKLNKILKQFQDGNQEIAYLNLKKYISKYSEDLIAIYNYAYMSENLSKLEIAIEKYIYIIKKDKNHWQSRFNLYLIYIQKRKYEEALKLYMEKGTDYNDLIFKIGCVLLILLVGLFIYKKK